MDLSEATGFAETWSGDGGLVPRGPQRLLGFRPASPEDVERHTGIRPARPKGVWRLEVGGRFLRSSGLVYPGGIPFPEELQRQTAIVSSEVWLYVDTDEYRVLGVHWWPEAVRRPIASVPRADFPEDDCVPPDRAAEDLVFELRVPEHAGFSAPVVVEWSAVHAVVFLPRAVPPEPLNEMVLFTEGGLSLRAGCDGGTPDVEDILRSYQPPFRKVSVDGAPAAGREPGKALGPQTWPWPGELLWHREGASYELKGAVGLGTLQEVAATLKPVR